MSYQLIKNRIEELRDLLNRYNYQYYIMDSPEVSDFEFDSLMHELINLEKKHPEFSNDFSPTKRIGGQPIESFKTIQHRYPMLSLSNTYSKKELDDFNLRVKKILNINHVDYTCEFKYDGVAISIVYENGILKHGVTRGNGVAGDDVTKNIKTIKSIPLKLFGDFPAFFEIRGEIFIEKNKFKSINDNIEKKKLNLLNEYNINKSKSSLLKDELEKLERQFNTQNNKLEKYSNARNFASGSLKLLDSSKVAKRNLDCVFYALYGENLPYDNHLDNLMKAKSWGFNISPNITKSNNIVQLMDYINKVESERDVLPFEIDGVVIKVNKLSYQNILGNTAKIPRWAISYKFKSIQVETILKNIIYQVGRTGCVTPVAELSPVALAGSVIKRASLHNNEFMKKLGLKIGDYVRVEKGGDVIPKVVSVNLSNRHISCKDINFVTNCPFCGSKLTKINAEVNFYCLNSYNCLPQKIGSFEHFISRDAMNIQTLGAKTIELLFEESIIDNIADLYYLNSDSFLGLPGFGEKSKSSKKAKNILYGINQSKKNPFNKVLYGLGIRYVGKTVSAKLAKYFKSIDRLMITSYENLLEVDEIGEKIAQSVVNFFKHSDNRILIRRLQNAGLLFELEENAKQSEKLKELSFVISGTFSVSREKIKTLIEDNGGKNTTSLSLKTNFLIAGEKFGNKKETIAHELEIPIISEFDLYKMLE